MTSVATAAAAGREAAQPPQYTAPGLTLGGAARIFAGCRNARLMAPLTLAAVVARLAVGGWRLGDLVVVAAVLALQPFTEWVVHVTVLHWRPVRVGRVVLDPLAARRHRAHHRDPKAIRHVLVPFPVLVGTLAVGGTVWWLVLPARLALTTVAATYAMYLLYEWTHFLIHSAYRPRRAYYRYIWRAHRLHHFRNEQYWFGVTVHLADHLLRTFPDRDAVPVSATARTLGVEPA